MATIAAPSPALRPLGVTPRGVTRAPPALPARPVAARAALPFSRRSGLRHDPRPALAGGAPWASSSFRGAVSVGAAAFPAPTAAPDDHDDDLPPTDNQYSELHSYIHRGLGSAVLLAATALSLLLANSFFAPGWCGLWGTAVGPALGGCQLSMQGWVNEGLMALFFFLLGLEVKREVCCGTLSNMKAAMLPCLAAIGGILVPVALFSVLNMGPKGLMQGWAIPLATDLALVMAIFAFFSNKMPQAASTILFTIATATNIGAIAAIPAYFTSLVSVSYFSAAASLAVSMFLLPKLVKKVGVWMYAVGGVALWYCLLLSGVSAGWAGVVAALAIPAAQLAPSSSNAVGRYQGQRPTLIDHLIHNITPLTALFVLPVFALANTAVPIDASLVGYLFAKPVALGIMAGALLGKSVGITAFSLLGIRLGLAEMPEGMNTQHLAVLGLLCSVGFTMSLALISASLVGYPDSTRLSRLAVIVTSAVAGIGSAAVMANLPAGSAPVKASEEGVKEEAVNQAYTGEPSSHATNADAPVAASEAPVSEDYKAGYDRGYYDGYYYGYVAATPAQPAPSSATAYASTPQNGAASAAPAAGYEAQPSEEYKAGYDRGYYDGYYYGYAAAQAATTYNGNGATSAAYESAPQPASVSTEMAQTADHLETLLPASEEPSAPAAPTPAAPSPSPEPEPSSPVPPEGQYSPEQIAFMERRKQELEKQKSGNA